LAKSHDTLVRVYLDCFDIREALRRQFWGRLNFNPRDLMQAISNQRSINEPQ